MSNRDGVALTRGMPGRAKKLCAALNANSRWASGIALAGIAATWRSSQCSPRPKVARRNGAGNCLNSAVASLSRSFPASRPK